MHYSAPPVIGGVESVIRAQAQVMLAAGYPVTVVAGRGERQALPDGTEFILIPELDSQHPQVEALGKQLEAGQVPTDFDRMAGLIRDRLEGVLRDCGQVIVHNVLTKHFNLPLTAALSAAGRSGRHPPLHRVVPRFHLDQRALAVEGPSWLSLGSAAEL